MCIFAFSAFHQSSGLYAVVAVLVSGDVTLTSISWLRMHICDPPSSALDPHAFLRITSKLPCCLVQSPTPLPQSVHLSLCGQHGLRSDLTSPPVVVGFSVLIFVLYVYFFYCEYQEITFISCHCRGSGLFWLIRTLTTSFNKDDPPPPHPFCKGKRAGLGQSCVP